MIDPIADELEKDLALAIVDLLGSFKYRNLGDEEKTTAMGAALAMRLETEGASEKLARTRMQTALNMAKTVWLVRHPIEEAKP